MDPQRSLRAGRLVIHGDLFDVLPTLAEASIDSCVTDPPYGIGFMGREWDTFKPSAMKDTNRFQQVDRLKKAANPNIKGRQHSPALSPSQIDYNRSLAGQRGFQEWTEKWAREVFRVLKPGAHLVVCGAPRSHHRMMCGLEDAGFEIRDCLAWLFGSGFPKSHNFGCRCAEPTTERDVRRVPEADVSAAVQSETAADEVLYDGLPEQGLQGARAGRHRQARAGECLVEGRGDVQAEQGELHRAEISPLSTGVPGNGESGRLRDGASAGRGAAAGPLFAADGGGSPSGPQHAKQRGRQPGAVRQQQRAQTGGGCCETCGGLIDFKGWGTALKPGHEPIALARKPFKGSITANHRQHHVGGLNVDGCRIEPSDREPDSGAMYYKNRGLMMPENKQNYFGGSDSVVRAVPLDGGRWPANVLLDEEAAELLDAQSGDCMSGGITHQPNRSGYEGAYTSGTHVQREPDSGGASRFFYVAKPSREERDLGCFDLEPRPRDESRKEGHPGGDNPRNRGLQRRGNFHPTVKPLALMRWLVRLVTPPNGLVLDPFGGSGTTAMACAAEGLDFVLIEREAEYVPIIEARVRAIAPLFLDPTA